MSKHSLNRLIDRYLAGKTTPEEETLLTQLYESMQEQQHWDETALGNRTTVEEDIFARLQEAIAVNKEAKAKVKRISKVWIIRAAAAIILLTITGLVIFLSAPKNKGEEMVNTQPVENDFLPGTQKAVLQLASGQTIILDSVKNGLVSNEGNTSILKVGSGQLVYDDDSKEGDGVSFNTLTVPKGGTYALTLADGTQVWLNAGSSLKYPTRFQGNERRVTLTGEGYFIVTHNSKQPFIVNAAHIEIKDLGTAFNINAYSDEPTVDVTLVNGLAQVFNNNTITDLQPGMQARSSANGTRVTAVDVETATAWKSDKFSFNQADISTIMRQLARWYDVEVEIRGVIKSKFDGAIYRSTKASNVFKILEETGNVQFRIEGRKIIVLPPSR
ncbi:MAG: FecR family protein [Agriterribacter sp.]